MGRGLIPVSGGETPKTTPITPPECSKVSAKEEKLELAAKHALTGKEPVKATATLKELSARKDLEQSPITEKFQETFPSEIAEKRERVKDLVGIIKERFDSPHHLTQDEIKSFCSALFSEELLPTANEMKEERGDVVALLSDLYEVVIAYEKDPNSSKLLTGGDRSGGVNGSYFLLNEQRETKWVFKPEKEEREGVRQGIKVGEAATREHLASVLDREGVYRVPPTLHIELGGQVGSVQQFIPHLGSAMVIYTDENGPENIQQYSRAAIQGTFVFDIRFNNTDRHPGNLLLLEDGNVIGIDNGCCMTASWEDLPL
jgi:hypothetical protein